MDVHQIDAARALMNLSVQTEIELFEKHQGNTPLGMVLRRFRSEAIDALVALVKVPFADADQVRLHQNEVQRYLDLLRFLNETLTAGEQAAAELAPVEQEELRKLLEMDHQGADDE
jgi:hypothetical protein